MHAEVLSTIRSIQAATQAEHVSAQEIADYLGVKKEDVLSATRDLVEDGLLVKKYNRFAMPDDEVEQASDKESAVMASLDELEKVFCAPHVTVNEYYLKQAVLHRLSQIVAADIGDVLLDISKDLEQINS